MNIFKQRGSIITGLVLLLLVVALVYTLGFFVFGKVVPPNFIGVRQNYYSLGFLSKGYKKEGLQPGLHWKAPFLSTIHLIPRDFQFIAFNANENEQISTTGNIKHLGDKTGQEPMFLEAVLNAENTNQALDIPTADGSKVRTDVTLVIRFFDKDFVAKNLTDVDEDKQRLVAEQKETTSKHIPVVSYQPKSHGGPAELFNTYTDNRHQQFTRVAQSSENEIKKSLSKLSTTNYYDPVARETKVLEAQEKIEQATGPAGIEIWGTLIRRYVYRDQNIDDQIFEKNLQEQKERLNSTFSALSKEKAETERVIANWDAKISVLKVEAETAASVIKSQGNLYEATQRAEGDLKVAEARARVDAEKARVLSDVAGAEVYVAREILPFLATINGGVVSGLDPFNVSSWVEKLTNTGGK